MAPGPARLAGMATLALLGLCAATARADDLACPTGEDAEVTTFGSLGQVAPPSHDSDAGAIGAHGTQGQANATTTLPPLPPAAPRPPLSLKSGCEYTVSLHDKSEVYLSLRRVDPNTRLRVSWDLEGSGDLPWMLFSWAGQCCGGLNPHASLTASTLYGDWGVKPDAWTGDIVYQPDPNGRDKYHCRPACRSYNLEPWTTAPLLITLSTWFSYGQVSGSVKFSFEPAAPYIKPDQLDVLKSVYDGCCAARQAPPAPLWNWERYKAANGTDVDAKPYCDWLPKPWQSMNFTDQSCDDIPGAFCDTDGNVVELTLFEAGLQCAFPDAIQRLRGLKKLDLGGNQISQSVPTAVAALPDLKVVSLPHNRIDGDVPCFASAKLRTLVLSYNRLTGELPSCYDGDKIMNSQPDLTKVLMNANRISGQLSEHAFAKGTAHPKHIATLDLSLNTFKGGLSSSLCNLKSLRNLRLSRNRFQRNIPPCLLENMPNMVELDLSYNHLEGPFPEIGTATSKLKQLSLQQNNLVGSVGTQLNVLVENIRKTAQGGDGIINLGANRFSGPLPDSLELLVYSGKNELAGLVLGGNHFRCDATTNSWPLWALRAPLAKSGALGACAPVPVPSKVVPPLVHAGMQIHVVGKGFVQSDELSCVFYAKARGAGSAMTQIAQASALRINSTAVVCSAPKQLVGSDVLKGDAVWVSVANFGNDVANAETVGGGFVMPQFNAACAMGHAGPRCEYSVELTCNSRGMPNDDGACTCYSGFEGSGCSSVDQAVLDEAVRKHTAAVDGTLIAGLSIACFAFVGCCSFALVMIRRERRGEPLFMRLPTEDDGMVSELAELGRPMQSESFTEVGPMASEVFRGPNHGAGHQTAVLHAVP